MNKEYIGDGAYAEFDGYGILVTAENGISIQERIYLEPNVLKNLIEYAKKQGIEL